MEVIFLSQLIKSNEIIALMIENATGPKPTEKELQNKLGAAKKFYNWLLERKLYRFDYYQIEEQACKDLKLKPASLRNHRRKLKETNFIFEGQMAPGNFIFFPYPEAIPGNIPILNWSDPAIRFKLYLNNEMASTPFFCIEGNKVDKLCGMAAYVHKDDIAELTRIRDIAQKALDDAIAGKPLQNHPQVLELTSSFKGLIE